MRKTLYAAVLALACTAALAATDLNRADQAELEMIKGIGPSLSQRILDEHARGPFSDWADLIRRVPGVGAGNAARFSASGLTVGGSTYDGAAASRRPPAAQAGAGGPPR